MPVRVNIPIKLRLSALDLPGQLDEVVRAIDAATHRALSRSRAAVIEPRGGYAAVRCKPATFTWRGEPDRLSRHTRQRLEHRISEALTGAVARSGILDHQELRRKAPEVMPAAIGEVLDPDRHDEDVDLYWIPSYDDAGKPDTAAPLKTKRVKPPPAPRPTVEAEFFEFTDETSADFANTFGWTVSENFAGRKIPNMFGVVYRIVGIASPLLSIWERGAKTWRLFRFHLGLRVAAGYQPLQLASLGDYSWDRVADPVTALAKWRQGYQTSLKTSYLDGKVVKAAEKDVIDKAATAKAKAAMEEYTFGWETKYPQFYAFRHPGGSTNYPIDAEKIDTMPPSGHVEVVPLATAVTVEASADPTATGTSGGRYKLGVGELPGDRDGALGGSGMVIALHYDADAKSKFAYRPSTGSALDRLRAALAFRPVCEAFWGEPTVHTMGPGGAEMWGQIETIARLLEMEACPYAANFAINAAKVLGGRAHAIGEALTLDSAEFLEDLSVGTVSNGEFSWRAVPSPAIQELRALANIVPLLEQLLASIQKTLFPISDLIPRGYFLRDFEEAMQSSIVWLYLYACQISLLQLLTSSRANIEMRLDPLKFPDYAAMTKILLTTVASDQVELIRFRDALKNFHDKGMQLDEGDQTALFSRDPDFVPTWNAYWDANEEIRIRGSTGTVEESIARHELWAQLYEKMESFKQRIDLRFRLTDTDHYVRGLGGDPRLGEIVKRPKDQLWGIFDRTGKQWTLTELNQTIAVRQQYIESADPIIQHIRFSEDVPKLLKNPASIPGYLTSLLNDMLDKNGSIRSDAIADAEWAFEHSKIELPKGKHDYYGNQSGLHDMAHQILHDAFRGSPRYPEALEALYRHQVGWVSLRDTFLFVGIVALAILCPPLGAVAGVVEAAWRYSEAKEMEAFYGALWDPSAILSRAEVEAQMFVARIGLVLAIVPAVGDLTSIAAKGIKAVAAKGLREGAEFAVKEYLEGLATQLAKKLGPGLIKEIVMLPIMMEVMSAMMDPFVEDAIRQIEVGMAVDVPEEEEEATAAALLGGGAEPNTDALVELVDPEDDL